MGAPWFRVNSRNRPGPIPPRRVTKGLPFFGLKVHIVFSLRFAKPQAQQMSPRIFCKKLALLALLCASCSPYGVALASEYVAVVQGSGSPSEANRTPSGQGPLLGSHQLINAPKAVLQALNARKNERAAKLLVDAAVKSPEAEYNLAVLFATGRAGRKDATAARLRFMYAAQKGYAPAFYGLAIMAIEGEAGPVNPIEAYTWLELYRRGLERSASTGEVKRSLALATLAQEKVSGGLTPDQLKLALKDADAWLGSSPTTQKVAEMLAKVNTVKEYAGFCRDFSDLNEGVRSVNCRIRNPNKYGNPEILLGCMSVIEQVMAQKVCDHREITFRKLLFYIEILEQGPAHTLPPETGVATALVVGGYCKPEVPSSKELRDSMQRMRENYHTMYQ